MAKIRSVGEFIQKCHKESMFSLKGVQGDFKINRVTDRECEFIGISSGNVYTRSLSFLEHNIIWFLL